MGQTKGVGKVFSRCFKSFLVPYRTFSDAHFTSFAQSPKTPQQHDEKTCSRHGEPNSLQEDLPLQHSCVHVLRFRHESLVGGGIQA